MTIHKKNELLNAAEKSNDRKFFQVFFENIAKSAIAIAEGLLKIKNPLRTQRCIRAEDVVQEVMSRIVEKGAAYFKGRNPEEMERYFRKAVRYECLNVIKRKEFSPISEEEGNHPHISEEVMIGDFEYQDQSFHLFAGLSEEQRQIIQLRITGHTFEEIADHLDIKRGKVMYQFNLAKEHILKKKNINK